MENSLDHLSHFHGCTGWLFIYFLPVHCMVILHISTRALDGYYSLVSTSALYSIRWWGDPGFVQLLHFLPDGETFLPVHWRVILHISTSALDGYVYLLFLPVHQTVVSGGDPGWVQILHFLSDYFIYFYQCTSMFLSLVSTSAPGCCIRWWPWPCTASSFPPWL